MEGQVAIVTGGGRGIGRAIAQALASAGMSVAVTARTEDQLAETVSLIEQAGGRAIALKADVTDRSQVEQMVTAVEMQLGPVDLLVNNAGSSRSHGLVWEADPEEWWRDVEINLRGAFLCTWSVLPGMIDRGRGRIIDVASSSGLGPIPSLSAYAVSKAAVLRFSENVAAETMEHGVSVFAISPGLVRTAMTEYGANSDEVRQRAPEVQQWFQESFREGRDVPPERAAELVVFLASGKADALSGRFIHVTDDVAEMVRRAEEIQQGELYTLRLRKLEE